MRKCRGKPIDNSVEWVYGWYVFDKRYSKHYIYKVGFGNVGAICEVMLRFEVIPETVGQETGLLDKNGKEIYGEGDIYKDAEGTISVVKMAVDGWALFPVKKGTPVRSLYWHNICDKTKGEVIGNIHENPELLEK